jgi:hypothetical protein
MVVMGAQEEEEDAVTKAMNKQAKREERDAALRAETEAKKKAEVKRKRARVVSSSDEDD